MGGRFSLIALKLKHSRWLLRSHGLQSRVIELDSYGCKLHFWAPASSSSSSSNHNEAHSFDANHNSTGGNATSDFEHFDIPSSSSPLSSSPNTAHCGMSHSASAIAKNFIATDAQQSDPCVASLKPALLFLHGFGGDGTLSWDNQVAEFSKHFSLYLPDLLCFGSSIIVDELNCAAHTTHTEHEGGPTKEQQKQKVRYSEIFQAECIHEAMNKMGVREATVLGHSYGGFVAYRMAHLYPSFVKKLVIVGSGIMMNPHTNDALLPKFGVTRTHDILVPPTLPLFIKSLQYVFNDYLPSWLPKFLYKDMFEVLSGDREGRLQLVDDIIIGTQDAPPLPTIQQSTLILWGEQDQIFDILLAHELKEFLGANAKVFTIKGVGHVPHMVKPKEFNGLLLSFLKTS